MSARSSKLAFSTTVPTDVRAAQIFVGASVIVAWLIALWFVSTVVARLDIAKDRLPILVQSIMNMAGAHNTTHTAAAQGGANAQVSSTVDNQDVTTQLLNASYASDCWRQYPDAGFNSVIVLKEGAWNNGQGEADKLAYFSIPGKKITMADLTGDGHREAVVATVCGLESATIGYEEVFIIDTSDSGMKVLQKLSPGDWGEASLGLNWRISEIATENGELTIKYILGGNHEQPDWDAVAGFRWDGRRFVRVDFQAHGVEGGSQQHQTSRKIMPIDEAFRDSSLLAFRNNLLAAVERRDATFLYEAISPTIGVGFGGEPNTREEFVKEWNMMAQDSKVWDVLAQVLQNGGAFVELSGRSQFVAPYTFGVWPKDIDSFEYCAVMSPDVSLFTQPIVGSTLVGALSYEVVKVDTGTCTQDQEWSKVSTGSGLSGFIQTKYLRSPIDYRAAFEKVDSRWVMTSLVAGD